MNHMRISKESPVVTLINVFETTRETQQAVIESWLQANEAMKDVPGLIGAALHKSLDGTRVVNYRQWRSREDFSRFQQRSHVGREVRHSLSEHVDPHLYEVVYIREQTEEK
jgi:heme-degrading monooxygenase HmoA